MGRLAHGAPELTDADIEDAMTLEKQFQQPTQNGADDDMAMDDEMLPDEDAEMEAMVASYQEQMAPAQQQQQQQQRPVSPSMLDDDYDDIFAELIAQEQQMDMAE